jgi:hypothetical protein
MRFYKINTLVFLCGVVAIYLNLAWLAAVALTFILVGGLLEFGAFREFYDFLYPQKKLPEYNRSTRTKRLGKKTGNHQWALRQRPDPQIIERPPEIILLENRRAGNYLFHGIYFLLVLVGFLPDLQN